ncbi:methanethiol S-methyltransferase [Arenimonas sp.]|uniref:methanethiol S-methyltransferase n=1 Tax=Arenimonas sp. TaxID=1872635 RepID=UPI0039E45ED4
MKRFAILLFGVATYAVFFATFLYLIAFVGNLQATPLAGMLPMLPQWVPHSIDHGGVSSPMGVAIAIDLLLILAFGLQHSVMARMGFKAWLKRHLPESAERSVYVLLASFVLMFMFWQWRPIPMPIWSASSTPGIAIGWFVFAAGFGLVLLSTFLIDHFDLFGLKQVWRQFIGRDAAPARFVTPWLYRLMRHPLYLGFILAFWGGPAMSAGHLLFATAMTLYILVAIQFEERDLVHQLGDSYDAYRRRVPMLVPGLPRATESATASQARTG